MTHATLPRLVGGALVAAASLALLASSAWGADAALIAKGVLKGAGQFAQL